MSPLNRPLANPQSMDGKCLTSNAIEGPTIFSIVYDKPVMKLGIIFSESNLLNPPLSNQVFARSTTPPIRPLLPSSPNNPVFITGHTEFLNHSEANPNNETPPAIPRTLSPILAIPLVPTPKNFNIPPKPEPSELKIPPFFFLPPPKSFSPNALNIPTLDLVALSCSISRFSISWCFLTFSVFSLLSGLFVIILPVVGSNTGLLLMAFTRPLIGFMIAFFIAPINESFFSILSPSDTIDAVFLLNTPPNALVSTSISSALIVSPSLAFLVRFLIPFAALVATFFPF